MPLEKMSFFQPARIGAVLGFLGVLAGAFGAHALKDDLTLRGSVSAWETAVLFHLLHAIALCALGWTGGTTRPSGRFHLVAAAWTVGILLFSGSLYLLAMGGPRLLGPITPIGGLFLLTGWALAAFLSPSGHSGTE